MALETASYVANLVVSNPDGADARSTADDHIRLIKAALRRTFPQLDGAVSLSAAQVHYIGDLSASVQSQFNALRDGSATAVNALYANSASVAANVGSIPAARVVDKAADNVMTGANPLLFTTNDAYLGWQRSSVLAAIATYTSQGLLITTQNTSAPIILVTNGSARVTVNWDGTITIPGLISGTISNATNAVTATTALSALAANTAGSATTANFADSCTSASSAASLAGLLPADGVTGNTVAIRPAQGYLYATYFNQTSTPESLSIGWIAAMGNQGDGFWRVVPTATIGQYIDGRNISTKSGTTKTLASGTGPPSLSGSTNGDIWYYY